MYEHSTHEIIVLKRQGSARNDSMDQHSPSAVHRNERKISTNTNRHRPRKLLDVSSNIKYVMSLL